MPDMSSLMLPHDVTRPRIAFCIFGQLRGEQLSFPGTARTARSVSAEVFLSTWKHRGAKVAGATNRSQLVRLFGQEYGGALPRYFHGQLHQVLPDLAKYLAAGGETVSAAELLGYFPGATVDIEEEVSDLDFQGRHGDANSLRMLYKIWRCVGLKRRREREAGRPFDLVVLMRADIEPPPAEVLLSAARAHGAIHLLQGGWAPGYANDMLIAAPSRTMDAIAALFGRAVLEPTADWKDIHSELHAHLERLGLPIKADLPVGAGLREDLAVRRPINRRALKQALESRLHGLSPGPVKAILAGTADLLRAGDRLLEGEQEELIAALRGLMNAIQPLEVLEGIAAVACMAFTAPSRQIERYVSQLCRMLCGLALYPDMVFRGENEAVLQELAESGSRLWGRAALSLRATGQLIRETAGLDPLALALWQKVAEAVPPAVLQSGLERLRQHYSHDPGLNSRLFWNALQAGQHEEARSHAERLCEIAPHDWRGFDHLGHYYIQRGCITTALAYARQALAMQPDYWGLIAQVGHLHERLGQPHQALALLQDAVSRSDDPHIRLSVVRILTKLDRRPDATAFAEECLDRFPDSTLLQKELAPLCRAAVVQSASSVTPPF